MIFINGQTVRSARSILLNSDSAAWRFRSMLRSAKWTKPTSATFAEVPALMSAVSRKADIPCRSDVSPVPGTV